MKRRRSIILISLTVLCLVMLIAMANPLPVWAQKPFYQGKTVEIIVPFSAGGGCDIGARYLSQWLPKFVPGNPKFVVINKPGSGGRIGANYVYNVAGKDGLTVMNTSGGVNLLSSLQLTGVEFDLAKMPLVIANSSSYLHLVTAGTYKNFKDLLKQEVLIYGHLPLGGATTTAFVIGQRLLGIKLKKLVASYGGSGDARRAFRAGEINCSSETVLGYPGHVRDYVKRGEVEIMWQTGLLDEKGNAIRFDPPLGDVPTLDERYKELYGKAPSGNLWIAHRIVVSHSSVFDKCLVFPPGTPSHIVKIVADACERMVKDPTFIAETEKKVKVPYIAGPTMKKLFEEHIVGADQKVMEWMRKWLREEFGVK